VGGVLIKPDLKTVADQKVFFCPLARRRR